MTNKEIQNAYVGDTQVEKICLGTDVVWPTTQPEPVYSAMPLTIEITSPGTINLKSTASGVLKNIEYKVNDGNWENMSITTAETTWNVIAGDKLQFRGNNAQYATSTADCCTFSSSTATFNAYGNIASLTDSTGYTGVTAYTTGYTFAKMFYGTKIVDASNLVLPATTLTNSCYDTMFENCYLLNAVPALPASTVATQSYRHMFTNCSGLTSVPKNLLAAATTLPDKAASSMFRNTRITEAPDLPATSVGSDCYGAMFRDNPALVVGPVICATTIGTQCCQNMFQNCTSLTTAPELHATTLARGCYQNMFNNCTSLNYIKCLATDISALDCTYNWVSGVASTGTFVKHPDMTSWSTGAKGIPTNWTVQNADI